VSPAPARTPHRTRDLPPIERIAAAAAAAGLMTFLWLRTDPLVPGHPWWTFPGDHHIYLFMAGHPTGSLHLAPWGWRVLEPAIVRVLPGSSLVGFQLVCVASLIVAAVAIHAICRRLGLDRRLADAGVLLFVSVSFATKYPMFDPWLPDSMALAAVALAVLFVLDDRPFAFAACLAVGVLAKESVVFAAPLLYTFRATRPIDPPAARRTLFAALPAVLVIAVVRLAIPAWNGTEYAAALPAPIAANARTVPDYSALSVVHQTLAGRELCATLAATASSFGLLVGVLPFLGGRRAIRLLVRATPFLALVLLQLLFAQNTQRLVVLASPIVVPLAVCGLATLRMRGVADTAILGTCAVFAALQFVSPDEIAPPALVQVAALAVCMTWMWWRRRSVVEPAVAR
jgi:hypothetical protein